MTPLMRLTNLTPCPTPAVSQLSGTTDAETSFWDVLFSADDDARAARTAMFATTAAGRPYEARIRMPS